MKNVQKALVLILCGALCAVIISCGSTGGGGASGSKEPIIGVWELSPNNDANDNGTSTIFMTIAEEEIDGEMKTTWHFAGEVTGAITYGVVDATLTPDEDTLAALKALDPGSVISFMMIGDGRDYIIEAPISTVTDWGFHRFKISTEPGVAMEHRIQMRFFMQPSWAQPVRFNRERLTSIRIQTVNAAEGGVGPFEFKVWDIKLFP